MIKENKNENETIHHDQYGNEYVLDENGNHRPPMKTSKQIENKSNFHTYDNSDGHCSLCGRLTCRENCFK